MTTVRADFDRADVRTLVPRGPVVHLYGRQHIDLQRVAGALCCA
ncbi:putative leader peptide [Streptomyces sp. NPDC088197]